MNEGEAADLPGPTEFSIVSGADIARIVSSQTTRCIEVIRDAYLAFTDGNAVMPPSAFLRFPDKPSARIIALPAHIGAPLMTSGIKWIASYPENVHRGLPRASGVLILNSHETGFPFACLEGSIISAARTAASAVLAAEQLRPSRSIETLAIVGTGLIARSVYRFMLESGWAIGRVLLHDLDRQRAHQFADKYVNPQRHLAVETSDTCDAAVGESDVVLFTTVAAEPHVTNPSLLRHNPLVLHLSLRDLAPDLILGANNIVDDVDHVLAAATSLHLTEQLVGHRKFINGTLSQVIRQQCKIDPGRPTIFSPFGMGVLDVALGKFVYDHAVAEGCHRQVPEFFSDVMA